MWLADIACHTHEWPQGHHLGAALVKQVSDRIGQLEGRGAFRPIRTVVLGQNLFAGRSVAGEFSRPSFRPYHPLPRRRCPLLRSSTLKLDKGIIVALGASRRSNFVVATDVSVGFLQVTTDPALHRVPRLREDPAPDQGGPRHRGITPQEDDTSGNKTGHEAPRLGREHSAPDQGGRRHRGAAPCKERPRPAKATDT